MLPRGTTLTKRGEAPKHEEIRLNDTFVAYKTKGGGGKPHALSERACTYINC